MELVLVSRCSYIVMQIDILPLCNHIYSHAKLVPVVQLCEYEYGILAVFFQLSSSSVCLCDGLGPLPFSSTNLL